MPPLNKTCIRCGEFKPLTEFYKHSGMSDGRLGKCKECCKSDAVANRRAKPEQYLAYDRARVNEPHRVEARKLQRENQKINEPEKIAARYAVSNAIRDGRLVKQPCEVCGKENAHGHHEDYSKPLEVNWLCHTHHMERHRKY